MSVNISAAFAKADRPRNGLTAIAAELVDEDLQHAEYYGVVRIKPNFFKVSAEEGERTPTVKLPQIEVVLDDEDVKVVREILARRYKDRTGLEDAEPDKLFGDELLNGERQVPEASGEELLAERRERKAREAAEAESDGVA